MGHSDDFLFTIQSNNSIEIVGNFGWETFQGIYFGILSMEYRMWDPDLDTLTKTTKEQVWGTTPQQIMDQHQIIMKTRH